MFSGNVYEKLNIFFVNRNILWNGVWMKIKTLTSITARNRQCFIRYPKIYLYVVQTLLVIHRSNIMIVRHSPRECVNFSRVAPTGYSSTKVVPLAFLSTRHRRAISRIFRNSSRGTSYRHREISIYMYWTSPILADAKND